MTDHSESSARKGLFARFAGTLGGFALVAGVLSGCQDGSASPGKSLSSTVPAVNAVTSTVVTPSSTQLVTTAPPTTTTSSPAPVSSFTPVAADSAGGESAACPADDYRNVDGACVPRPTHAATAPAGATARCNDGTYSFSQHRRGTCSHHGGVAEWL
ncbi:DUF3761 domain-containing protein [Amycolatopsis cynarae]|uniref:DUF3761 domain-containing protein n=1 Tax=Amycolatopsis cynarae TaxID=2995223 RepID=A0ABY7B9Y6_9PSEU|nr:DUF3761 domain-containing protein [Amycolatopsis sp. HUAS 11-8]WAL68214.1 DUF3761 domain-containing protein [Amycolatopsis sp. HUAS 11-8]